MSEILKPAEGLQATSGAQVFVLKEPRWWMLRSIEPMIWRWVQFVAWAAILVMQFLPVVPKPWLLCMGAALLLKLMRSLLCEAPQKLLLGAQGMRLQYRWAWLDVVLGWHVPMQALQAQALRLKLDYLRADLHESVKHAELLMPGHALLAKRLLPAAWVPELADEAGADTRVTWGKQPRFKRAQGARRPVAGCEALWWRSQDLPLIKALQGFGVQVMAQDRRHAKAQRG